MNSNYKWAVNKISLSLSKGKPIPPYQIANIVGY